MGDRGRLDGTGVYLSLGDDTVVCVLSHLDEPPVEFVERAVWPSFFWISGLATVDPPSSGQLEVWRYQCSTHLAAHRCTFFQCVDVF